MHSYRGPSVTISGIIPGLLFTLLSLTACSTFKIQAVQRDIPSSHIVYSTTVVTTRILTPSGKETIGRTSTVLPTQEPAETAANTYSMPVRPLTSCPRPSVPSGIYPYHDGFFHDSITTEAVNTTKPDVIYNVYAGALRNSPLQGVIFVVRWSKDPCAHKNPNMIIQRYLTPLHEGTVKLTQIIEDIVIFTTSKGSKGHFNYVLGQFLPS